MFSSVFPILLDVLKFRKILVVEAITVLGALRAVLICNTIEGVPIGKISQIAAM